MGPPPSPPRSAPTTWTAGGCERRRALPDLRPVSVRVGTHRLLPEPLLAPHARRHVLLVGRSGTGKAGIRDPYVFPYPRRDGTHWDDLDTAPAWARGKFADPGLIRSA
ncbi:hypothetical protein [Streptomyces sp. RerS4]|uniref:hypothetical protein n=1 Tax=Streptomyces sp. RerS4 TaxID=2942449 RepID=UPI00201BB153|nr:hypothetical protein [Streptomyces sp. RerS4]UQW99391.1 hypothetical protein M4D82_01745 [Streptomyces sp. RerS4]